MTTTHQPIDAVVEDVEWLLTTGELHPESVAHRTGYRTAASLYAALRRAERRDLIRCIITRSYRKDA